jgi:hypothetical protein
VVRKVQSAVVRYLGPIHRLWAAGPWTRCCWSEGLSDKVKVRPLPPTCLGFDEARRHRRGVFALCQGLTLSVLELALKSDELQLASENDAYALVGGWVAGWDEGEQTSKTPSRGW